MSAATKTREIVEARILGLTPDIQVYDFEIRNIETVMEDVESEALRKFPENKHDAQADDAARYERIHFYKTELLKRFAVNLRPRLSAVFHQYVAACIRGGRGGRSYTFDRSGAVEHFAVA